MTKPLPPERRVYRKREIECSRCGELRTVTRPNARWCSSACRQKVERPDLARCACCRRRRPLEAFAMRRNGERHDTCATCRRHLRRLRRIERARALVPCGTCKIAKRRSDFSARSLSCRMCGAALAWAARRRRET